MNVVITMKQYCTNCVYKSLPNTQKLFSENETIFLEGNELNNVYVIEEGLVKISKIFINGEEKIFDILGPGEFLALVAVLKGDKEYIATAVALSDCVVSVMEKDIVKEAYTSSNKFKDMCLSCAMTRTNLFQSQLSNSLNEDIEERIINVLTFLSSKFGELIHFEHTLKLPISKTMLAGIVGIRRETLSRKLSKMKKDGIITIDKNIYKFRGV